MSGEIGEVSKVFRPWPQMYPVLRGSKVYTSMYGISIDLNLREMFAANHPAKPLAAENISAFL